MKREEACSKQVLLSANFEEFSPMNHMTSREASLATAFPSAYNDNEPFSLGLDSITFDTKNVEQDNQI